MFEDTSKLVIPTPFLVSEVPSTSAIQEAHLTAGRIPIEIWQDIFLIMLSSESIPELDEIFGPVWGRASPSPPSQISHRTSILPQTPSLTSQVCRCWRSYAFGMPSLWNVLVVNASQLKADRSIGHLIRVIKDRLLLSKSMPLKICIIANDDEDGARKLIHAIIPFSSQWDTIHLQVSPAALSELDVLRQEDLPCLTALKMEAQPYILETGAINPDSPELAQIRFLKRIPNIRRLCTSYFVPTICPVFAGLEELHIRQHRSETWSTLQILAACPRLRVLTLSGYGVTKAAEALTATHLTFVLPVLETLNLEHPVGREPLLGKLVVPTLKSLWIGGRCFGESIRSVLNSILLMMKRSEVRSLERLSFSLEAHTMDSHLLITFLRYNFLLKELRIDDTWFPNHPLVTSCLLHALTDQNTINHDPFFTQTKAPCLCPRLERVSFTACSKFEDEKLLAFLKSRCLPAAGRSLEELDDCLLATTISDVDISVKREIGRELIETAHCWKARGLSINLRRA